MDLQGVADRLAAVPGVVSVVLGGSRARGLDAPGSDTDIGLFYASEGEPLDVDAFRATIADLDPAPRAVTELHEWGPWVNGGAWTTIDGLGDVDVIYRSLEHVERTLDDLERGERKHDWNQQPPFGFTSVIYGGEVHGCVSLHDPTDRIAALKQRVADYPDALRRNIVQQDLWLADFSIRNARKPAYRSDVPTTIGCLTRAHHYLTQALFALNRTWFVSDKTAMAEIDAFPWRPHEHVERTGAILAGAVGLVERVEAMAELYADTAARAGDLYIAPWQESRAKAGKSTG